jgi:hypothetical protein
MLPINAKLLSICIGLVVIGAAPTAGPRHEAPQGTGQNTLRAEIESLRAPNVAWRKIAWKTCLLDGLKEARTTRKPVLLWIFIDRPVDDARC